MTTENTGRIGCLEQYPEDVLSSRVSDGAF
jgi:hypothetical protein